ncbi:hypothetical protein ACGFIV_31085 [Sphaerisporangium sp. NPDC049003]|uniref:hypothetical protein n=1 Tax=Sphaerisporangium sp. NPDC049003 TaxID=3364517 RepID=UPI003720A5BB
MPTVTITQTVTVPTSVPTPVITIAPPSEGIDWWKDVVWGDFGGGVLGVLGGLLAAWLVIRAERGSRKEEIRRTLALDYANAARRLSKQLGLPIQEGFEDALESFELLTGRIVRLYSKRSGFLRPIRWIMARFHRHVGHSDFAIWVMLKGSPIGTRFEPLRWAINDLEGQVAEMNRSGSLGRDKPENVVESIRQIQGKISEISTDLRVIEHTTLEWMRSPRDWEPDLRARESLERVKKLISGPGVTPQEEPTPHDASQADDASHAP